MRTKIFVPLAILSMVLLLAVFAITQDIQQPRIGCVASDCSTLFVKNTGGTVLSGGHAATVTAAASTAVAAAQTSCVSPTFAACNFLYVTNAGGAPAVTQTLATAGAAGNVLLAMIETNGTAITRIAFPNQSGTVYTQALGPLTSFSVGPTPSAAGTLDLGTAALPWRSAYLGTAATNNIRIVPLATAGARPLMLSDPGAAGAFAFADPTVTTKQLAFGLQGATGASTIESALLAGRTITLPDPGAATATIPFRDVAQTWTGVQTMTSPALTTPVITTDIHSAAAGGSSVGTALLPFGSIVLGTAATNAFTFTPAALGAARAINIPDPGGAATLAYTNSTNAQILANNTYVSSAAGAPATAGAIRLGNAESINWRNQAGGANIGLTVNAANNLIWDGTQPTDGYYFVGPEMCSMALTTGTFAANPATSGALSAPSMVRAASGNSVLQLTTTAAANVTDIVCDFTPPSRLTAGQGIIINGINVLYGYQTTAPTSIGTVAPVSVTYPAPGGAAAGTVAAIGGALTVTPGTDHATPGAVTTTGQCYNEGIVFGTPYAVEVDNTRLSWQVLINQTAASATVAQVCGTVVHYTTARP